MLELGWVVFSIQQCVFLVFGSWFLQRHRGDGELYWLHEYNLVQPPTLSISQQNNRDGKTAVRSSGWIRGQHCGVDCPFKRQCVRLSRTLQPIRRKNPTCKHLWLTLVFPAHTDDVMSHVSSDPVDLGMWGQIRDLNQQPSHPLLHYQWLQMAIHWSAHINVTVRSETECVRVCVWGGGGADSAAATSVTETPGSGSRTPTSALNRADSQRLLTQSHKWAMNHMTPNYHNMEIKSSHYDGP